MQYAPAGHVYQAQQLSGHTCINQPRRSRTHQTGQAHTLKSQPTAAATHRESSQTVERFPESMLAPGSEAARPGSIQPGGNVGMHQRRNRGMGYKASGNNGQQASGTTYSVMPKDEKGRDPCMQAIFAASSIQELYELYQKRHSGQKHQEVLRKLQEDPNSEEARSALRFSMGIPHYVAMLVRLPKLLDAQSDGVQEVEAGQYMLTTRSQSAASSAARQQQLWQVHRLVESIITYLTRCIDKCTYRTLVNSLWAVAKLDYEPDQTAAAGGLKHTSRSSSSSSPQGGQRHAHKRSNQQRGNSTRHSEQHDKASMTRILTSWVAAALEPDRMRAANMTELSCLAYALVRLPLLGLLSTTSRHTTKGGKAAARQDTKHDEQALKQQLSTWWSSLLSAVKANGGLWGVAQKELSVFGWSMARSEEAQPDAELLVTLFKQLERVLPTMQQHSLSISMWSAVTLFTSLNDQQSDEALPMPTPPSTESATHPNRLSCSHQTITARQALHSMITLLVHVLVAQQLQGGWHTWHSQHVANIIWAIATFKGFAWKLPASEDPGACAALEQYGVQLAEWADAHFVANHARYQPEEMAMLSWAVARLNGRCSTRLLTLVTQHLEHHPAQHSPRNLLCFATAAACTGAGSMAGSERATVSMLTMPGPASTSSRYGGKGDYAAAASIDMALLTAEESDGPRCQDESAYALGRVIFLRMHSAALQQQHHKASQASGANSPNTYKSIEVSGIIVMAARLGVATAEELEELSGYLVSRCSHDAPVQRWGDDERFNPYMFSMSEQVMILAGCGYVGARVRPLCQALAPVFKKVAQDTAAAAGQQHAAMSKQAKAQQQGSLDNQQLMALAGRGMAAHRLGFKDIADAAWGFARAGWQDGVLYHTLANAAQQLLLLQHSIITNTDVLKDSTFVRAADNSNTNSRAAEQQLPSSYHLNTRAAGAHVTPDAMLALARGLSAANYYSEGLYDAMVLACRSMVGFCSASQLVSITTAMAHAQHYSLPLFNQLATAALGCVDQFQDKQVSHMAWSFATMHVYHPGLFKALVEQAILLMESGQLTVRGAGMLLWSCAVLQHNEPTSLARIFNMVWSAGPPSNLMQDTCNQTYFGYIMMVLAQSHTHPSVLSNLLSLDTVAHASSKHHTIDELYVLWPASSPTTDMASSEMEAGRQRQQQQQQQQGTRHNRRQRQRLRSGVDDAARYPPPIPMEYRQAYAHMFLDMKRSGLLTSDLQAEVFDMLKDMGTEPRMEVSIMSGLWRLDLVVQWQGQAVAVEVDGPHHFARNVTTHALGHTVARNRCLKALGVPLACLHWQEWKAACKAHAASLSAAADNADSTTDGAAFKVQQSVKRVHRWRTSSKQSRKKQGSHEDGMVGDEGYGSDPIGALPASVPLSSDATWGDNSSTAADRTGSSADARVALLERLLSAALMSCKGGTSHRRRASHSLHSQDGVKAGRELGHGGAGTDTNDRHWANGAGGLLPDVPLQVRYSVFRTPRKPQALKLDNR